MTFENHLRRGHPITFGLIILFGIIEIAISAWLTSRFNAHHNYISTGVRDRTRFLLFTSLWTVVFSVLYTLLFWRKGGTAGLCPHQCGQPWRIPLLDLAILDRRRSSHNRCVLRWT
ncbi:hypothetical protein QCA50_002393 [Cerrena zonata]|uniref:Uncharacterized protein n=1 Tax=Cerrena zonata TaxID=2478898 RepID=A0AAW0GNN7_9APHY